MINISSYIFLTLDTAPPQLEIFAPKYTTREIRNHITIKANEQLSSYQDIYIIDSEGIRHDYVFLHNDSEFNGIINFNSFPLGRVTLFARVKDVVDNISDLYQVNIKIKDSISRLKLDISHAIQQISLDKVSQDTNISLEAMKVTSSTTERQLTSSLTTRELNLSIEN